jgi:pilus assembly protein CpaB
MRTKSLVLLILALGCGLVASIGISQIIEQNKHAGPAAVETEAILVAMKPIAGQEQLKAENIKLEQWPKNLIPKGALSKIEEVEGRRIKHSIAPGEPILQNKLVGEQDKRATVEVPPGYRLVAVHADAVSAVGNLVQPGDRVDVLVYLKNFHGPAEAGATTILQDIKVFAVNDQWRPGDDKGSDTISVKNVALLVTPEQAEKVTLATELGKVKLVLRSPDDNLKVEASEGTTPKDLFGLTDDGNREHELNFLAQHGKQKQTGGGILGMFGVGQKSAAPPVDVAAVVPSDFQHFTMELLEGPQARTIEFTKAQGETKWQSGMRANNAPQGAALPQGLPQPGDASTGFNPGGLPGGLQQGDAVSLGLPAEKD